MSANENLGLEAKSESLDQHDYYGYENIDEAQQEYAPAIGRFLISFSILERGVNAAIASFVQDRSDELGLQITASMEFADKVRLFFNTHLRLVSILTPQLKQHLTELRKRLIVAAELRNVIAHAQWGSLTDDGFVRSKTSTSTTDGGVEFLYYKLTPDIIDTKTKSIVELEADLDGFVDEMNTAASV